MRRILAWLVAILGVATAAAEPLPAADSWWLLASGRFLAETGQIRAADPFSFTAGPWFNHEWLFGLGAFELYGGLGWEGLYWTRTLSLVLAFAVLPLWAVRKSEEQTWAVALLAAGYAWMFRSFYDVRPYLGTYVLCAACLVLVRGALEDRRRQTVDGGQGTADLERSTWWRLAGVAVGTALWANLHGAFILGPGMLVVAGVGCLLERRARLARQLFGAGFVALLAAMLNPYGWRMLAFPFSLFGNSAFRLGLNEWSRPALFGEHALYWVVVLIGAVATWLHWRAGQKALALLTLVFLLGGATAWRNLPLACLAGVQLHAVALRAPARLRLATVIVALGLTLLATPRLQRTPRELGLWDGLFPGDATRFLAANPELPHKLSNPYEWGGWLTWHLPGWRIFIDGRAHTVYSEQTYLDAMAIQFGGPWEKKAGASWDELLRKYQLDLVLVTRMQGDLDQRLGASPDWERIYQDRKSAIYLRKGASHGPLVYPETSESLCAEGMQHVGAGAWDRALPLFQRAVQLSPGDPVAHLYLGVADLRAGYQDAGITELETALRLDPNLPDAHFNLGSAYRRLGDLNRARQEMEAELRVNPRHPEAARALRELQ